MSSCFVEDFVHFYSEGGLKDVDIKSKIVALQLTWIRVYMMETFTHGN